MANQIKRKEELVAMAMEKEGTMEILTGEGLEKETGLGETKVEGMKMGKVKIKANEM